MRTFDTDTPAGRAIELVGELVKQGRMSSAERRVIEELIWRPDMPESLRRTVIVPGHPPGTDTARRPFFFEREQIPSHTAGDTGDVPMVPRRPVDAAP